MNMLITGGTVFASRFCEEYFLKKGHTVYVINRNTKPRSEGGRLIERDGHALGDRLKNLYFDLVSDVTEQNRLMPDTKPLGAGFRTTGSLSAERTISGI